ncbi:MAG: hypothetical protein ACM31C_31320, partial [Acidobacteriota bacterium]
DPGYALDCCGNDLVLTCKQTLDMAPMIRALSHNKDCGCTDPCAEPTIAKTANQGKDEEQKPEQQPCKQYCLYARYAERPDQPVATYPVAGDCDSASCEPTRVVEGIVFELRCPTKVQHPNIHDAWKCCKKLVDTEFLLRGAESLRYFVRWVDAILAEKASAGFKDQAHESLEYEKLVSGLHGRDLIIGLTRYVANNVEALARAKELGLSDGDAKTLQQHVHSAAAYLSDAKLDDVLPFEAAMAQAAANVGGKLELRPKSIGGSPESMVSPAVVQTLHDHLHIVALQVTNAAGCGTSKVHTDCCLDKQIEGLGPRFPVDADVDRPTLFLMKESAQRAVDVTDRLSLDCACAALNPPCPPCDDPGVLLACIEVDHCKVVKICNTVRGYVYAPSSLRYWDAIDVPEIPFCCGYERHPTKAPDVRGEIALRYDLAKARELGARNASMRMLMTPAVQASAAATVHEGELAILRAQVQALEARCARFEAAAEKLHEKPAKGPKS